MRSVAILFRWVFPYEIILYGKTSYSTDWDRSQTDLQTALKIQSPCFPVLDKTQNSISFVSILSAPTPIQNTWEDTDTGEDGIASVKFSPPLPTRHILTIAIVSPPLGWTAGTAGNVQQLDVSVNGHGHDAMVARWRGRGREGRIVSSSSTRPLRTRQNTTHVTRGGGVWTTIKNWDTA